MEGLIQEVIQINFKCIYQVKIMLLFKDIVDKLILGMW